MRCVVQKWNFGGFLRYIVQKLQMGGSFCLKIALHGSIIFCGFVYKLYELSYLVLDQLIADICR